MRSAPVNAKDGVTGEECLLRCVYTQTEKVTEAGQKNRPPVPFRQSRAKLFLNSFLFYLRRPLSIPKQIL